MVCFTDGITRALWKLSPAAKDYSASQNTANEIIVQAKVRDVDKLANLSITRRSLYFRETEIDIVLVRKWNKKMKEDRGKSKYTQTFKNYNSISLSLVWIAGRYIKIVQLEPVCISSIYSTLISKKCALL